jgi:hypothetical protein
MQELTSGMRAETLLKIPDRGASTRLKKQRRLQRWLHMGYQMTGLAYLGACVVFALGVTLRERPDLVGVVVAGETGRAALLKLLGPHERPAMPRAAHALSSSTTAPTKEVENAQ